MVIAAGRLDEIVPLEPAAMPGRTIVQWDKDDCADLGIIKVDLLGLGMLNALEEAIPIIRDHERLSVDLAHLPADDPKVYAMLRAADTVGVFQVESRAQMASLPRNAPTRFYDLVIQVAIIRPGPITGGMVHPFFERRRGREPVTYFDPCLEPILKRTLGIPLFQEQLLRIAMTAAGFSGGEAEELRRAMGFKRSVERMEAIEARLRSGMAARGITGANQDQIVQSITSFALYGFPESHAASFALIAYASAYLKCYHPTAFLIALLNAWPMGFYHPASLVKDAQRHGVAVLPIDVNFSGWRCLWEELKSKSAHKENEPAPSSMRAAGACRIGLRYISGLRRETAERIAHGAPGGALPDVEELKQRAALRATSWPGSRRPERSPRSGSPAARRSGRRRSRSGRKASSSRIRGTEDHAPRRPRAPCRRCPPTRRPWPTSPAPVSPSGAHPLAYARPALARQGVVTAAEVPHLPAGQRTRIAGAVIVRQRPGTANGTLFVTLEDETGMVQAIVQRALLLAHRATIVGNPGLVIEGVVQQRDGSVSLQAEKFWPLSDLVETPSHDFH